MEGIFELSVIASQDCIQNEKKLGVDGDVGKLSKAFYVDHYLNTAVHTKKDNSHWRSRRLNWDNRAASSDPKSSVAKQKLGTPWEMSQHHKFYEIKCFQSPSALTLQANRF